MFNVIIRLHKSYYEVRVQIQWVISLGVNGKDEWEMGSLAFLGIWRHFSQSIADQDSVSVSHGGRPHLTYNFLISLANPLSHYTSVLGINIIMLWIKWQKVWTFYFFFSWKRILFSRGMQHLGSTHLWSNRAVNASFHAIHRW